ncbi:stage V sporulation protein AB [Dethiothermospora halolimnae]|uniref:stage V sporulation protein AB n=1 Tax=Dethiothermospora halolimnae TaxID=3114390 RepID=UPI003CCBD89C
MDTLILILVGFSGGVVTGSAVGAFITLLDIVPRLAQISKSTTLIRFYEKLLTVTTTLTSILIFFQFKFNLNDIILIPIGTFIGIFVGLLAAALAEVINVIPILARRLRIRQYVFYVFISMALGKVVGSLIHWFILD